MIRHWQTARFRLDLRQPLVMGIVNVTPDSFSDGGRFLDHSAAIAHAESLIAEGAAIVDIGGESTRPGARQPDLDEELARVLPVVKAAVTMGVPVSVDTSRPEVMAAALDAGADIVNDVRALQRPGAIGVFAAHAQAGVCLMHMQGEPQTMQAAPHYANVVDEVKAFLLGRRQALLDAGIAADRIALDPGIGFGKTPQQNLALLAHQRELLSLGSPLLVGWSRKSTIGHVTRRDTGDRLPASLAAALLAVQRGARIVRVHDVAATVDVLKFWQAATPSATPVIDKEETS
jgi:dihydropteroate synthase